MDLWIRSQDKKRIIKVEQLEIREDISDTEEQIYSVCSINFKNTYGYNFLRLGFYKTEKRALEILDKIQNRIVNLQLTNLEQKGKAREDVLKREYLRCVYEMPKE